MTQQTKYNTDYEDDYDEEGESVPQDDKNEEEG